MAKVSLMYAALIIVGWAVACSDEAVSPGGSNSVETRAVETSALGTHAAALGADGGTDGGVLDAGGDAASTSD